ncbi:hypothetical protein [Salarchaeum sp. JOR-1]|uniref:hypothetical protein n=1 Tax=Salarchaeum sp. JOR-1 TaxID=2599399 RepID=UPI001198BBAA|nr:hypothetical protein [Salarchaeum sp. JOR-1]QDX40889.1 hypothetical protein FQU85_08245 [Salarchaeum sp. JOR-1]
MSTGSKWRYVVYAMPVVTAIEATLGLFLVGVVVRTGVSLTALAVLAAPFLLAALVVRFLLPIAIRADARVVHESTGGAFDGEVYAMAAVPGVFVPVVDSLIALRYLSRSRSALDNYEE